MKHQLKHQLFNIYNALQKVATKPSPNSYKVFVDSSVNAYSSKNKLINAIFRHIDYVSERTDIILNQDSNKYNSKSKSK